MKNPISYLIVGLLLLSAVSCSGDKNSLQRSIIKEIGETEFVAVRRVDNNKWVYIDRHGKEVFNKQFDGATIFLDGIAIATDSTGLIGFLDTSGKWIIEPKYASATNFHDGLAWVALPDSALMVIDKKGDTKFSNKKALNASMFQDGYTCITLNDESKQLLTTKGEVIEYPEKCVDIDILGNNYVSFIDSNHKRNIGRIKGNKFESLTEIPYDVYEFIPETEQYIICSDNKYGLADIKGNLICNPQYSMLRYDSRDMYIFENSKEKYGWINSKGAEIIPAKYKEVKLLFYWRDYATVSVTGNKYMLIDREGKTLISSKYTDLTAPLWSDKVVVKMKDEGYGIVSTNGDVICKPQFDDICNVAQNMFMATTDGHKWGVIDDNGIFVGAIEYEPYMGVGANVLETAESHFFDYNYLKIKIKELISKVDYKESVASLAEVFGTSRYDVSPNDWFCTLKTVNLRNLGVELSVFVSLDSPALIRQGYSKTSTKFNPNAYPTTIDIALRFDSQKKCEEAYKYLARNNGQEISADLPESPYFVIHVNQDKSYNVISNEEYD